MLLHQLITLSFQNVKEKGRPDTLQIEVLRRHPWPHNILAIVLHNLRLTHTQNMLNARIKLTCLTIHTLPTHPHIRTRVRIRQFTTACHQWSTQALHISRDTRIITAKLECTGPLTNRSIHHLQLCCTIQQ
uniref:Uncharacterized protein n=1 Tax=Ciona intestinalis TaxID=7719 RepID=F6U419_CIOIN